MAQQHILVVDDEPDIRRLLKEILDEEGFSVSVAENGEAARNELQTSQPDLVLLDIWMPDIDGVSLLKEWSASGELPFPVIMISGHGTVETAVEATRLGAFDFIEKPLSLAKLLSIVERALEANKHKHENTQSRPGSENIFEPVGKSKDFQEVRDQAQHIASFDSWILISGESGSGKKTFARYIHNQSNRKSAPFIEIQSSLVIADNAMAELFGQEEDGVVYSGKLEQAQGGTLFLRDVAEMDYNVQTRLSSVLESRSFIRVGGVEPIALDVRIIASSNQNLEKLIENGKFHNELFYELNVVPFKVPSLREHCEDVPDLLQYYVDYYVNKEHLSYRHFNVAAQNRLRNYLWPGNILELQNMVQRLLILGGSEEVSLLEVEQTLESGGEEPIPVATVGSNILELPLREAREQFEREYLQKQLQVCGSVGELAKIVGMERTNLYRKLRSLGIDVKQK